jgi:hypothetical protein
MNSVRNVQLDALEHFFLHRLHAQHPVDHVER